MPDRTLGRIQTRAAFAQVQRSRSRASCGPVRATFVPVPPSSGGIYPQVGYAISKKCGNAVTRNTLRRRMRDVARAEATVLPRGLYLLRLEPAAATAAPWQFRADVAQALQRAVQSGKVTA